MTVPATTGARPVRPVSAPDLLRTGLRADAWSTAVLGAVLLFGGERIGDPLGLPLAWSVAFGIGMLAGAAVLALIARRRPIAAGLGWTAVTVNTGCAAAMLVLAFVDALPLTVAGKVFMVVGALVVGGFAAVYVVALRRSARSGG
ncbi:hypothetical protein [Streptomyces uncialis]|uniref:hypothetical protein n=1 Tax=Streptomyces uncialis TaxID=1048205 RepID=UPI00225654F6|nr:hypothetical protein [Streptomyces uncialis]MCX4658218.1 hypothetical protein [Streptomyces uncialis]